MLANTFQSVSKDSDPHSQLVNLTGAFSIAGLNIAEGTYASFDGDELAAISPDSITRAVVKFLEKNSSTYAKELCVITELSDRGNGYEVLIAESRGAIKRHPQNVVMALGAQ